MKAIESDTYTYYTTGGTKFTVDAINRKDADAQAEKLTGEKISRRNHRIGMQGGAL